MELEDRLYKTYSTQSSRIEIVQYVDDVGEFAFRSVNLFLLSATGDAIVREAT